MISLVFFLVLSIILLILNDAALLMTVVKNLCFLQGTSIRGIWDRDRDKIKIVLSGGSEILQAELHMQAAENTSNASWTAYHAHEVIVEFNSLDLSCKPFIRLHANSC